MYIVLKTKYKHLVNLNGMKNKGNKGKKNSH